MIEILMVGLVETIVSKTVPVALSLVADEIHFGLRYVA